jgi:hypothetical protein
MKIGDRVTLLRNEIPGYPITTVAQIDDRAGKVQVRFKPRNTEGYSYLFWRDFADIQEFVNTVHHGALDTVMHTTGEVTDDGGTPTEV